MLMRVVPRVDGARNVSLPVLFDCAPRAARMLKSRCAEDWYLANGGSIKKLDALSSIAKCTKCPVGEKNRQELADEPQPAAPRPPLKSAQVHAVNDAEAARRRERIRLENRATLAAAEKPAPAPRETTTMKETQMEKKTCEASGCGKTFVAKQAKSRTCSSTCYQRLWAAEKSGAKPTKPTKPRAAAKPVAKPVRGAVGGRVESLSTLVAYLELLDQVDAFEREHPDVLAGAEQMLDRIVSRKT